MPFWHIECLEHLSRCQGFPPFEPYNRKSATPFVLLKAIVGAAQEHTDIPDFLLVPTISTLFRSSLSCGDLDQASKFLEQVLAGLPAFRRQRSRSAWEVVIRIRMSIAWYCWSIEEFDYALSYARKSTLTIKRLEPALSPEIEIWRLSAELMALKFAELQQSPHVQEIADKKVRGLIDSLPTYFAPPFNVILEEGFESSKFRLPPLSLRRLRPRIWDWVIALR